MESALALPFIHPPRGLDGDEFGFLAQDAQEFVGGSIRAASAGFPFGEGGLRNAEGGGKVSLIETETAADVRNKGGGVAVWRDMAADDKGAAGRVEWKVVPEADPEGLLCNIVELSGYVLRVGRMMATIAAEFREGADVSVIFLTPADDAGEIFGIDFCFIFHGRWSLPVEWRG